MIICMPPLRKFSVFPILLNPAFLNKSRGSGKPDSIQVWKHYTFSLKLSLILYINCSTSEFLKHCFEFSFYLLLIFSVNFSDLISMYQAICYLSWLRPNPIHTHLHACYSQREIQEPTQTLRPCQKAPAPCWARPHVISTLPLFKNSHTHRLSRWMVPVRLGNCCTMLAPRMTLQEIGRENVI